MISVSDAAINKIKEAAAGMDGAADKDLRIFIQGVGWLTTEELWWSPDGALKTHAPSTYKIPTASDRPDVMNIALWEKGENREKTIRRSKAVGEPPVMLANAVFCAITDAVG